MSTTWPDHYREFPEAVAAAIRQRLCFCKCGCRAEDVEPQRFLSVVKPGLCHECEVASHTTRGRPFHELATQPWMTWRGPTPEPSLRADLIRALTAPIAELHRADATKWILAHGSDGTTFMQDMYDRVVAGKVLTDGQVRDIRKARKQRKEHDRGTAASSTSHDGAGCECGAGRGNPAGVAGT